MAATTLDRQTLMRYVQRTVAEDAFIAASTTIPAGVLVAANATGDLVNAADVAGLTVLGRAPRRMVNSAGVAAKIGPPRPFVEAGCFKFFTTGVNAITAEDLGKNCYVLDNQTVVRQAGTANNVIAGIVDSIDSDGGIWVKVNC